MTKNQQTIQSFVGREISPWLALYTGGPWITQETAARFQQSVERAAVAYVEERALTEAVATVLGASNPAVPFVVLGIKQVLDAETPRVVQLGYQHPEVLGFAVVCAVVFLLWRYIPEA